MLTLVRDAHWLDVRVAQPLSGAFACVLLVACGATNESDTRDPGGRAEQEQGCDSDACSGDVAAVDTNTSTPCPNDDVVAQRATTGTRLLQAAPSGTGATPGATPTAPPINPTEPNAEPAAVPLPVDYCGDGQPSSLEQCDDGNTLSGDGCDSRCFVEDHYECPVFGQPCVYMVVCGDGLVGPSEVCDDGNVLDGDGCSARCNAIQIGYACTPGRLCEEVCGDGILTPGEGCEDGNVTSGDGCNVACRLEPGYTCFQQNDFSVLAQNMGAAGAPGMAEPAPTPATERPLNCVATLCGDGIAAGGEACDDGNDVDGDGCRANCSKEPECDSADACVTVCGDALLIAGAAEECDDGNAFNGDGCDALCQVEPGFACDVVADTWDTALPPLYAESMGHSECSSMCGDGVAVAAEVCDEGTLNGLGYGYCSSECSAGPRCGDGIVEAMEECDNGANTSRYYDSETGCAPGCIRPSFCGDGVVDSGFGEQCDLGVEQNDGALGGCSSTCELSSACGDGVVQSALGESCDDGNTSAGDGCDANCNIEVNLGPENAPEQPAPTDDVFVPPPNPPPDATSTPRPNPCL